MSDTVGVSRRRLTPWYGVAVLALVAIAACDTHHPDDAAVEKDVRAFAQRVAQDITRIGPAAWSNYFSDSPSFFMAAEGRLEFPDGAAASRGIQDLTRIIKHIELRWGNDLRVDPLTSELAMIASSYYELRVDTSGQRVEENGFFTGLAEIRNSRWQFRDAHWSVLAPTSPR